MNPRVFESLWTFGEIENIELTNNAAEQALHPLVIQRKISCTVQFRQGAICRSRLLTVTMTMRQQDRDGWDFLEKVWVALHRGGVMPFLMADP